MEPDEPSAIEAIARAVRLYDRQLVDAWIPAEPSNISLRAQVCALGCGDEQAVDRIVDRLLKQLEQQTTLLDEIHWLCRHMSLLRGGLPILRPELLPRQLSRIVSPSALFPFHPELNLPDSEPFNWPTVPLTEGGRTESLLREGSIDTHIHLGGTLPPLFYWLPLMGGGLHLDFLRDLPATERGHADADTWRSAVGQACWRRLWLAALLERSTPKSRLFPWLAHGWIDRAELAENAEPFAERRDPGRDHCRLDADDMRELALDLDNEFRIHDETPLSDWPFPDPLRPPRINEQSTYDAGERRLLYLLGRRLAALQKEDPTKAQQLQSGLREYLMTRNAFHRLMVHDQGREGLLRFVQSFQRRRFLFGNKPRRGRRRQRRHLRAMAKLEQARMDAGLDSQLVEPFTPAPHGPGAADAARERRIEMRVSVPETAALRATLRAWTTGLRDHIDKPAPKRSQVGLIFHFIKRGNKPEHAETALDAAERLEGVLRNEPELRRLVVGIDAAGKERGSTPRIFLKAFHNLRQLQKTFRPEPEEPEIRLGYTYHVGEDVDDLLTGLRHIDEAVSLLIPQDEGGRLGHALALGENVTRFHDRRDITEPRLGSHLLDLVWARGRLVESGTSPWVPWLTSRIKKLCDGLAPNPRKCFDRMCLDRELQDEDLLREDQLLDILAKGLAHHLDLDAPYPVPLRGPHWLKLVEFLQECLRDRVAHRRVCVEANPTSNLIIGDYKDYDDLPYTRLVEAGIAVSLNTDDPGLFMTNLPGELAAMYDGLDSHGELRHREILTWLRERLFDAEQSTFLGKQVPIGKDAAELCRRWLGSD